MTVDRLPRLPRLAGRWVPPLTVIAVLAAAVAAPPPGRAGESTIETGTDGALTIGNAFLARTVTTTGGILHTTAITNRLDGKPLAPLACDEFRLELRWPGGEAAALTTADFEVTGTQAQRGDRESMLIVSLRGREVPIGLEVRFTLGDGDFFLRKRLVVTAGESMILDRVDVEAMRIAEARQPYRIRAITAQGAANWKPGLGQPLYTEAGTGTFWGTEFPAADNRVDEATSGLRCGYFLGRQLAPNEPFASHPSVVGVADDPAFVRDAFLEYIERIRVRPLRLQVQYNSWFDHGGGVSRERFAESVAHVDRELVDERGAPPLSAYVIDDGWQDTGRDWSRALWPVNAKFDADLASSRKAVADADSTLGIWISPGCLFGAQGAIPLMKGAGFESIDPWMSMAGPRFMAALENRLVELVRDGTTYFKLDGLFGHYITRNFELDPGRYGLPPAPASATAGLPEDITGSDARLDDPRFDELKIRYLSAGTERLIGMFRTMAEANPEVYIVISNGAWLSPWWLQHVDSVWMINAGDAAAGSTRTEELVYRDERYHELWTRERTQFPLCALFNHEPKKTESRENKDTFRRYLYMSLSRGTGFVELYIKPRALAPFDWDVLAEGLEWARAVFPTFPRVRMHGGNPGDHEVYGYTAWNTEQGYVSIHNPSAEERRYRFLLDRAFGLPPKARDTVFHLSSPIDGDADDLPTRCRLGDEIALALAPGEIRILHFNAEAPSDWSRLAALRSRTTDDYVAPEPIPIEGHPILGTWRYVHGGQGYSREFTVEGRCLLREGDAVVWEYPFTVESKDEVLVAGQYRHRLRADGALDIEGRYRGERQ